VNDLEWDATTMLREHLTNEVAGHMPASMHDREPDTVYLIRSSTRWGFDQVIAPLIEVLEEVYQVPGVADCLGDELHERLRAAVAGELS
jgi:hypothetical protein